MFNVNAIRALGRVLLKDHGEENYVVSFEGEIEVGAETKELAENQAYDRLSHLGQITVMAFKKEEE